MEVEIIKYSVGSALKVKMQKNEFINSEPGAFVASRGDISIDSSLAGGIISGAMRMLGGGESAFINKLTALTDNTEIYLAPPVPSDIQELELDNEEYLLGDGAYLAHTGNVDVSTELNVLDGILAGQGIFFLKVKGTGKVYISGEGSIIPLTINEGETVVVDNSNFLATNTKRMEKVILAKGVKSLIVGGEGIGFRIRGPAKVLIRTNSTQGLAEKILKYIKS